MRGTHQMSLQFRQTPLCVIRIPPDQAVAHHKAENGIPQEFQLFIVYKRFIRWPAFERQGFMRQSTDQKIPIPECTAEFLLQLLQIRAHLKIEAAPSYCLTGTGAGAAGAAAAAGGVAA